MAGQLQLPVTYDPDNLELRSVVGFFRERYDAGDAVTMIRWTQAAKAGTSLVKGMKLADIIWSKGGTTEILAPEDSVGRVIGYIDPSIDYDALHWPPSEVLVHLH